MKKLKKLNLRETVQKFQENCDRINEIADICEKENRERTEAEDSEYASLLRENQILQMKMQANVPQVSMNREATSPTVALREYVASGNAPRNVTLLFNRELMNTSGLADTGIIPVSEQEMLKPLRAGLIYDLVGINVRTGLSAGKLRWAKHTKAVGAFADEGVRLTDSKVDFDKLTVVPHRLGIAIPITNEELTSTEGIVEDVINEEIPAAIVDLVNDAMFTTTTTYTDKDGASKTRKVYGPFVEAAKTPIAFAAQVPTRKELLKMRAKVLESGIKMIAPCWVMTEAMKAELEGTPLDAGSGRFLIENDTLLGHPVFTTPGIGAGVGFGDWSYQAAGFFGQANMTVDPYTLARQNATDFVFNTHFATVTLRQEAFVYGKKTGA